MQSSGALYKASCSPAVVAEHLPVAIKGSNGASPSYRSKVESCFKLQQQQHLLSRESETVVSEDDKQNTNS